MPSETLIEENRNGVAILTLNRPDRLNSFTEEMHAALFDAMTRAQQDKECRAVLLTGAGRGFCAGQDLGERDPSMMGVAPDLGASLRKNYNPLIRLIRSLEKPVVCAVNGVAAGAGANMALACDIVLAARSARFIQAFCKIGLIPDAGGTWSLSHLVGEARAKALALTGEPVGAEQAAAWGMIWKAIDDDALMAEAEALTESLAAGPTVGLGLAKQAIQAAATNSLERQLEVEADCQREAGRTPDYAEGVAAFLEKRPANFTGCR